MKRTEFCAIVGSTEERLKSLLRRGLLPFSWADDVAPTRQSIPYTKTSALSLVVLDHLTRDGGLAEASALLRQVHRLAEFERRWQFIATDDPAKELHFMTGWSFFDGGFHTVGFTAPFDRCLETLSEAKKDGTISSLRAGGVVLTHTSSTGLASIRADKTGRRRVNDVLVHSGQLADAETAPLDRVVLVNVARAWRTILDNAKRLGLTDLVSTQAWVDVE